MSNSALDNLNAQIEQARQGALAAVSQGTGAVATNTTSAPVTPGRPVSLSEVLNQTGMQVKAYLKVDKAGFFIGQDTVTIVEEIPVEFRLSDVTAFYGIRYGNPAKYLRSYDRITEARTKRPWADMIAEAQRQDTRVRGDYPAVDVPFTLLADIKSKKGDAILAEAGDRLGWTSSVTNFKEFANFARPYEQLQQSGALSPDAVLRGKLVHDQRKDASNLWGALTLVDFEIVSEGEQEAA